MQNKTFICEPGECGAYSSVGYEILGLILAAKANVSRWQDYDQLSVLPAAWGEWMRERFRSTVFPTGGKCTDWGERMVHQYKT